MKRVTCKKTAPDTLTSWLPKWHKNFDQSEFHLIISSTRCDISSIKHDIQSLKQYKQQFRRIQPLIVNNISWTKIKSLFLLFAEIPTDFIPKIISLCLMQSYWTSKLPWNSNQYGKLSYAKHHWSTWITLVLCCLGWNLP